MKSILHKLAPNSQPNRKTNSLKKFTKPKIYHGGKSFDLKKRWYVYYSYLNPKTNKLVQQPPVYDQINRLYKTKEERLEAVKYLQKAIELALKEGFSPYENEFTKDSHTVRSALYFALSIKKETLENNSYKDYKTRSDNFIKYLSNKRKDNLSVEYIDKNTIIGYLNYILKKTSPRNRNNTKTVLSALFTVLEDNEIISRNFIKNIKNLKSESERNKTYSIKKVEDIYKYLEQKDKVLLLFIKFVSYNFLRPVEVCRLKVKDVNIKEKTITVKAKNKAVKTKIIPDILINDLLDLDFSNPEHYLFTPKGVGEWETEESNKRNYFGKRFKKVKDIFKLGKDYTIYSFRHTFITKLYRALRKKYSKHETLDKLMLVTGHSTLKALNEYLRDIDAELPEDYSDMVKI